MSSDQPPPPPSGPPPAGPPPSGPPPSGPPPSGPPAAARSKLPWIVGIALVAVLAVVVVLVVTLTGSKAAEDAETVQDVADIAVDAAEDLDVDAGIDLLCEPPSADDREDLESLIDEAQERTGTDDPDVSYGIGDIDDGEDGSEGSFLVTITSTEDELVEEELELKVLVESRDGRSCIAGVEDP